MKSTFISGFKRLVMESEDPGRSPGPARRPQILKRLLIIALLFAAICVEAKGQGNRLLPLAPTPTPAASPEKSPTVQPVTPAITLADAVTRAESTTASLLDIQSNLASDQTTATIDTELPGLAREIDAHLAEDSRVLSRAPFLETLSTIETDWQRFNDKLTAWQSDLTVSAVQLDKTISDLAEQADTWGQTLGLAQALDGTPPEVLQRIQNVISTISQTRTSIEARRASVLVLQSHLDEQISRVRAVLHSISQARDAAFNRLFVRGSPPIWSAEVRSRDGQNLIVESQNSFSNQLVGLRAYAEQHIGRFVVHVAVILLLTAAFYRVRPWVKPRAAEEPGLEHFAVLVDIPVAAAVVLSTVISSWIYPDAPRLWKMCLGAIAIIPAVIILRRLVERPLLPILNALVFFYFVDLLRTVTASLWLTSRMLLLAEMLAVILFLVWWIKSLRSPRWREEGTDRLTKTIETMSRGALVLIAAAFFADILGYVTLASLVANKVLVGTYLAVVLYATSRIATGLVMITMLVRPLNLLGAVRNNLPLLRRYVRRAIQLAALLVWLIYMLDMLALREPVLQMTRKVLTANLAFGSLKISLGNVLAFAVTVLASFLLSRFVRFILEEDVYPHLDLARGIPYAVSTTLHYVILLVGFVAAIAALGVDMTKFTILAGGFGLGLGFGLQNILNNFVSGLVLLFERPVKVGDVIHVNDAEGIIKRIGIRASIISASDGSDVIVPNAKLLSDMVTNWTFLNRRRRVDVRVGAPHGTDPAHVMEILKGVAHAHPLVAADPQPQVVFTEFVADLLTFELRAWVNNFEQWLQVRTDLAVAINSAFAAKSISMHVDSVPETR